MSPEAPSFAWAAVKMILSLALVLGVLLVVSRYAKRYLEGYSRRRMDEGKDFYVAEGLRLGPKTQVVVLAAFGRKYLLGLTPGGISVIDKVRDGDAGEAS
jgi:flagellar biogenesis protein FliO